MRSREGHDLSNSRMIHKHDIHFIGRNLFASPVDHFLEASRDEKVTIRIQKPLVTGPEPTIPEGTLHLCGIVFVTPHHVRATNDNFALLTLWQQGADFVHDGDLRPSRNANRTRLTRTGW